MCGTKAKIKQKSGRILYGFKTPLNILVKKGQFRSSNFNMTTLRDVLRRLYYTGFRSELFISDFDRQLKYSSYPPTPPTSKNILLHMTIPVYV